MISLLHFFSRRPRHRLRPARRAAFAALLVFLLSLALLAYADSWYADQLLLEQQAATRDEVRARAQVLSTVLNAHLSRLQGLLGFVLAAQAEQGALPDLETYAAEYQLALPAIRYLAVAPGGIVRYVAAADGSLELLGQRLDQLPEPEVRASVDQAAGRDGPVLAGPLTLPGGSLVLVGTQAVYEDGQYWGLLQIVLDLDILLADPAIRPSLFPLEQALADDRGRVFLGPYTLFARNPAVSEIVVGEQRWTLAGLPPGGWQATIQGELLLARAAGLLIALLLSTVVYLAVDRQQRLAAAVAWRTRELAEAHQLLEERVEARTRELQTLLDVSRNVASTLDFPSLLSLLLEQVQDVIDFSSLAVYLVRDEDRLELEQVHGAPGRRQPRLNGDLLALRAPVLIADTGAETPDGERWRPTVARLLGQQGKVSRSLMIIPLLLKNRLLGLLLFENAIAAAYTPRHVQLALAMANHVAVAIENARLYEQAHSLAALQERQKLARELHDSVSQALYGIGLGAHTALTLLEQNGNEGQAAGLRPPLEYTLSLARAAQAEMRALIFELRPESLEVEGLLPVLSRMAEALQARHQIEVLATLEAEPPLPLLDKEVLYRVAQEALHNVAKHAAASRVALTLTTGPGHVLLEISDNGSGFNPQGHFPGHLGLQSMRERVEGAGGQLQVQSTPGEGTVISVRLPHRLPV